MQRPWCFHDKFGETLSKPQEEELRSVARALIAAGKGVLTMDDSVSSMGRMLERIGLENETEYRRRYREVLINGSPSVADHLSGILLSREALYQTDNKKKAFVKTLKESGILAGITVDTGWAPLAGSGDEFITQGLDDLEQRCVEYKKNGVRFTNWRCVMEISDETPSYEALTENADALGRYARVCQEHGLLPMLGCDVLTEGSHDLATAQAVAEQVLAFVIKALSDHDVLLEGTLLKVSMVTPGQTCTKKYTSREIAAATVKALMRSVPPAVPGILFLSGGLSDEEATSNLDAINRHAHSVRAPWTLTFAFGRAVQTSVLQAWGGREHMVYSAQMELHKRLTANGAAALGRYHPASFPPGPPPTSPTIPAPVFR